MSTLIEETTLEAKTKDLCAAIVADDSFIKLQGQVEKFLSSDEARLQYQSVQEMGERLNEKQQSGVQLSDSEISQFEEAREQVLNNATVTDFMNAQKELQDIQKTVSKLVGMTLELGRVPTDEDIEAANNAGGG